MRLLPRIKYGAGYAVGLAMTPIRRFTSNGARTGFTGMTGEFDVDDN